MDPAGRRSRRLALDAEQELGIDEDALEAPLNPGLEAAGAVPRLVEAQQGVEVSARHRPPPRPARQRREDLARARLLLGGGGGPADEDPLPARRLPRTGRVERTGDADLIDGRLGRLGRRAPALGDGENLPGGPRLQDAVALRASLHERDAEHPRPRPGRDSDLEVLVGVQRVLLPRAVAEHRARERARGRRPRRPADGERGHALPVQPHLELLPVLEPAHVVVELAPQPDPDVVLAVEGEVVPNRHAPARPEREVLAHAAVLEPHRGQDVGLGRRLDGGVADREPADLPRREDVAVEQGRGHRQDVRHVVEPEVRVVGRQQGGPVDLEGEQVPHGVGVLPPVEAVDGGAAGIGVGGGDAVEGRLEGRHDGGVGGRLGPRPAHRGHRPRPQLPHDRLPRRGVVAHAGGVQRVEREPGRLQPLVVTGDAVAVEDRADRTGVGLPGGPRRAGGAGRLRLQRHRRCGRRRKPVRRRGGVPVQVTGAGHRDAEPDDACCPGSQLGPASFNEAAGQTPRKLEAPSS